MVHVIFNTAAIASAKQLGDSWERSFYWKPYTPEPKPSLVGKITIKPSRTIEFEPSLDSEGYDIYFRDVTDINILIEKLTKLRNQFIEKGEE